MRFAITLHVDVPDGTDTDAYEVRNQFEEQLETAFEEVETEFSISVVSCEQVVDES